LEETKATMFYFLKVFDEYSSEEYSLEKIDNTIKFLLFDSIRQFFRLKNPEHEQYGILLKIVIHNLFEFNLINWKEDQLCISSDKNNFYEYISNMKDILYFIKDIYIEYNENDIKKENKFIESIEDNFEENLEKILKLINS
jgi:hypothetical protein